MDITSIPGKIKLRRESVNGNSLNIKLTFSVVSNFSEAVTQMAPQALFVVNRINEAEEFVKLATYDDLTTVPYLRPVNPAEPYRVASITRTFSTQADSIAWGNYVYASAMNVFNSLQNYAAALEQNEFSNEEITIPDNYYDKLKTSISNYLTAKKNRITVENEKKRAEDVNALLLKVVDFSKISINTQGVALLSALAVQLPTLSGLLTDLRSYVSSEVAVEGGVQNMSSKATSLKLIADKCVANTESIVRHTYSTTVTDSVKWMQEADINLVTGQLSQIKTTISDLDAHIEKFNSKLANSDKTLLFLDNIQTAIGVSGDVDQIISNINKQKEVNTKELQSLLIKYQSKVLDLNEQYEYAVQLEQTYLNELRRLAPEIDVENPYSIFSYRVFVANT